MIAYAQFQFNVLDKRQTKGNKRNETHRKSLLSNVLRALCTMPTQKSYHFSFHFFRLFSPKTKFKKKTYTNMYHKHRLLTHVYSNEIAPAHFTHNDQHQMECESLR